MIERKKSTDLKSFTFKIMDDDYTIKGTDSTEYMQQIAGYLQTIVDIIIQNNSKINKCQVAVLAALKIADELHKLRKDYQYLDDLLKESK